MNLSGILAASFFYWSCALAWQPSLKMATGEHRVHFVTNTKCPYAQRKPGWFMDLNPKGEVPVIVVDGGPIVGSEETIDYLMQGPLNPEERRAISSRWRGIVNDRLKPSGKRAVFSGGSTSEVASLTAVLKDLEACLADGSGDDGAAAGGPFVCGDIFTAADASAFPFLQRVHGKFGFPSECAKLEAWYASASRRPGVRKTIKKDFWWWW
nr:glutathione S-transferase [Saccharina japonica]